MRMSGIRALVDEASFEAVLAEPRAIVYKHSPACGTSAMALDEVKAYIDGGGPIPVYVVDVVANRELSQTIARRLNVMHQSPQVILLEKGVPTWKTSHWEISAHALAMAGGRA